MPKLRDAMQIILDEMQKEVEDELEKVSLERLAMIDSSLLIKIKRTAEDSFRNGTADDSGSTSAQKDEINTLSFLVEMRTPETIERSKAWGKVKFDHMKETHDMITTLQHLVRDGSTSENRYTRKEAMDMTGALAAASTTASILTSALQQMQNEEKKRKANANSTLSGVGGVGSASGAPARGFFAVDKKLFTNEGIRKKNDAVIGLLYHIGLPFVSSSDGRRFATQLELSNHLDALFKKGYVSCCATLGTDNCVDCSNKQLTILFCGFRQLEKSMARTEERGWYVSESIWGGEPQTNDLIAPTGEGPEGSGPTLSEEDADPSTFTMPADENRDRCVICGINFKMFFDNDDGIYKYSNCREVEVLNDDAAEKESEPMLVHVTCWRGLGSPQFLAQDQALEEVMLYVQ